MNLIQKNAVVDPEGFIQSLRSLGVQLGEGFSDVRIRVMHNAVRVTWREPEGPSRFTDVPLPPETKVMFEPSGEARVKTEGGDSGE